MGTSNTSNDSSVDTIVAISTPPGRGGIGVVRLSGPQAVAIATPMLRLRHALAPAQARFAELIDPATQERLDEAVITWFAAPHSYTSEDVVEIAAHGAPVILEFLVRACIAAGARLARPGEFTERAFLAGRIDLTQAEAVRDLIDAQTLYQAKLASEQLGGALSRRIRPVKQALVDLIAEMEAGIDFAEDDIDVLANEPIRARITAVASPLVEMATSFAYGRVVRDGFSLAILGRPNAGKSSLFNRLAQRERAIVTATPGTTRDLVTERVSLGGIPMELIDTAGLRAATDEAERLGIAKSREAAAEADVVLLVLDASSGQLDDEERALLQQIENRRALVVLNKVDVQSATAWAEAIPCPLLRTSALTGEGIAALQEKILESVRGTGAEIESALVTNLRQQQAVNEALAALEAARVGTEAQIPHEMLLLDLYGALRALDALTGETTLDDILHQIFSTFCIGK